MPLRHHVYHILIYSLQLSISCFDHCAQRSHSSLPSSPVALRHPIPPPQVSLCLHLHQHTHPCVMFYAVLLSPSLELCWNHLAAIESIRAGAFLSLSASSDHLRSPRLRHLDRHCLLSVLLPSTCVAVSPSVGEPSSLSAAVLASDTLMPRWPLRPLCPPCHRHVATPSAPAATSAASPRPCYVALAWKPPCCHMCASSSATGSHVLATQSKTLTFSHTYIQPCMTGQLSHMSSVHRGPARLRGPGP